jgi:excisionase family DNA binding protein
MRVKIDKDAKFQSIRGACEITGLSQKYLREGCRNGEIPFILVGSDYRINMPLFLEQLDTASGAGKPAV